MQIFSIMLFAHGLRLFNQKSESDVRKKTINAGQILAKMGEAKNGLYTKHLLKNLETPGLPVEQVFSPVLRGSNKKPTASQLPGPPLLPQETSIFVVESPCPFLILSRSSLAFLIWQYCFLWSFPIFSPSTRIGPYPPLHPCFYGD